MKHINKIGVVIFAIIFILVGNTVLAAQDWNSSRSNKTSKTSSVPPNPQILDQETVAKSVSDTNDDECCKEEEYISVTSVGEGESGDVPAPQQDQIKAPGFKAGKALKEVMVNDSQDKDDEREFGDVNQAAVEKREGMEIRERQGMEIRERMGERQGMEARQGMGLRHDEDNDGDRFDDVEEKNGGNDPIPGIDVIVKRDPAGDRPIMDAQGNELDGSIEAIIKRAVQEKKNVWAKPPVEELKIIAIEGKDAEVEAVKLNEDNTMSIDARQKRFLFGLIPVGIGLEAVIDTNGGVQEVHKPWYTFLLW